jgi:phage host-nuclease inhibitor protein Gam
VSEQERYIAGLLEESGEFRITDDLMADWAIEKINAARAERDRLLSLVDEKIGQLEEKRKLYIVNFEDNTSYLRGKLMEYFQTVKTQDTKTMKKYKLVSGTLVLKRQQPLYERDETALLTWAEQTIPELVKVKKEVSWADLKKQADVSGDKLLLDGEIIPGVTVVEREDVFEVQV